MKLQAYEKKETETLQALRTAPFGMWLEFLREDHAEEMNAGSIPWLLWLPWVEMRECAMRWEGQFKDPY